MREEMRWKEKRNLNERMGWVNCPDTKRDLCQAHNVFHDRGINVNIRCEAIASIINVNI